MHGHRPDGAPAGSKRAEPRWQRVLGTLFALVAAVVFAGLAMMFAEADARFGPGAPTAESTILAVELGKHGYLVVEFTTADGRQVRGVTEEFLQQPEPEVGDRLRVLYDPAEPELYVRDAEYGGHTVLVALCGASSLGFVVFAVWTLVRRTPRAD